MFSIAKSRKLRLCSFEQFCPCICSNRYAENPLFFTTYITVLGAGLCRPVTMRLKNYSRLTSRGSSLVSFP